MTTPTPTPTPTTSSRAAAAPLRLTYVFDAYCGWCYGFSGTIRELVRTSDVDVEVISGGLFSGTRSGKLADYPHIPAANARISSLTGAHFGQPYQDVLAEGSLLLDSDDASTGLAALKTAAPEREHVDLAAALQRAFYVDGLSLSEPDTYRVIARAEGIDPDTLVAAFTDPATAVAAAAERQRVRDLGVDSYPTLLAHTDRGLVQVGSPVVGVEQLAAEVARLAAA